MKQASPTIVGVVVRVSDFEASSAFYRDDLGFSPTHEVIGSPGTRRAELANGSLTVWLVEVDEQAGLEYPRSSKAHLNIEVANLDEHLDRLVDRGVRVLAEEPRQAAIGPNMPIEDPAGNIVHLLELTQRSEKLPKPTVFNLSVTVPTMADARAFYEGVLGFRVYSEEYYPPVIPFVPAGPLQVVLHESAQEAVDRQADQAQVNLVFAVDDLEQTRRELAAKGATLRPSAGVATFIEHLAVVDPFGNVHLVLAAGDSPMLAAEAAP
ncbi:MAG: VOC family protein [Acidobacteriota bacterium]